MSAMPQFLTNHTHILTHTHTHKTGLKDDFENTMWLPPTLKEAYAFKFKHVFKGGEASMFSTDVCSDPALSAVACLYFIFIKHVAWLMLWLTILSLPLLLMSFFGSRTSELDQDPMGLYLLTLGNVGYDKSANNYADISKCTKLIPTTTNGTCIHFDALNFELRANDASNILTACEFIQGLLFLWFIRKLKKEAKQLMSDHEVGECTVRDYSIMIRDIPADTTPTDLLIHFNRLYPLDVADWKGRPRIKGAKKVEHIENSQQSMYMHSWIADISLHKKIGKFIRAFRTKSEMMYELMGYRARMKMYADNTPHSHGPNKKLWLLNEKKMMDLGLKLDQYSDQVFDKHFVLNPDNEPGELEDGEIHESKVIERIDADVTCAFVTFQYSESMARCVEDYAKWDKFPLNIVKPFLFPNEMKLRGTWIKVEHAPEPDELIWENLEIPWYSHEIRKFIVLVIASTSICIAFAIIVQASIYKVSFAENVPKLSLCNSYIPELYMQNGTTGIPWNIQGSRETVRLVRPAEGLGLDGRAHLDSQCQIYTGVTTTFFGLYAENSDVNKPVGHYNMSTCTKIDKITNTLGFDTCPATPSDGRIHEKNSEFCPCFTMTPQGRSKCHSIECTAGDLDGSAGTVNKKCIKFASNTMAGCYCYDFLTNMIATLNPSDVLSTIDGLQGHVCQDFLVSYSASQGLTYAISILVVLINSGILWLLKALTNWEKHTHFANEQASYLIKVAVSLYLSLCIVVLIAYGRIEGLPEILAQLEFFQGPYLDFTPAWYSDVGLFLVTTFVIQAVSPLIADYWAFYISYPLGRCIYFPKLESQSSHKFAMQAEVNKYICGPVFDPTHNQAMLLSLFFCTMTFSTGIPILQFFTFLFFVLTFRANKILLLRFFQNPPHGNDGAMQVLLQVLPFAGILRLGFAIWMLGNDDLLEAAGISTDTLSQVSGGEVAIGGAASGADTAAAAGAASALLGPQEGIVGLLITRATRPNCVPLTVLLIISIVILLLEKLWRVLPVFWAIKIMKCIISIISQDKTAAVHHDVASSDMARGEDHDLIIDTSDYLTEFEIHELNHHLRQESAPFTGEYYQYCYDLVEEDRRQKACWCFRPSRKHDSDFISDDDKVQNWHLAKDGKYVIKEKLWNRTTVHNGEVRKKGEPKRTFELLDETGTSSYELDRVPRYKLAMKALEEGILLHEELADIDDKGDETHTEHYDKLGNMHRVPVLKAKPSVLNAYDHHKARIKVEKLSMEDWEVDGDDFNDDYKRIASRKAIKASHELNANVSESYLSHKDDEEWSEGSEEEDESDDEGYDDGDGDDEEGGDAEEEEEEEEEED